MEREGQGNVKPHRASAMCHNNVSLSFSTIYVLTRQQKIFDTFFEPRVILNSR